MSNNIFCRPVVADNFNYCVLPDTFQFRTWCLKIQYKRFMCTWAGFQHFNYDRKKIHVLPKKGVIVQTFLKGSSEKKNKKNFSVIITKALKVVPTMGMSNRQIYTLILLFVCFFVF